MTREEKEFSFPTGEKTSRAYDIEIAKRDEAIKILENNIEMMKFDADALRNQRMKLQFEMSDLRKEIINLKKQLNA